MSAPQCPSTRTVLAAVAAGVLAVAGLAAGGPGSAVRAAESAEAWYRKGYALQQELRTVKALEAYKRALALDPFHGPAHYEIGWSYWLLEEWEQVVRHWELAREAGFEAPQLATYLEMARERAEGALPPLVRVPIGTRAEGGGLALALEARFQHFDPEPAASGDHFDRHVFSPKSVQLAPDGAKAYVQALEGRTTIVYDARALRKLGAIPHAFGAAQAHLFDPVESAGVASAFAAAGAPAAFNRYEGKPVEGVFSHGGRYLWVSHYRRSFDPLGVLPSALAVVDTATERIVRVLPTGPIPKTLAVSPDGRRLAAVHWGDNTVGLFDASGDDPRDFRPAGEIVVEKRLALRMDDDVDRDHYCGFCLRGAVFTRDGRHLLVGRMGGGGIAVLDVAARRHVGTVHGMKPTPRHLVLSADGERLYVSSSASGYVSLFRTAELVAAARAGRKRVAPLHQARTGRGTRTIALGPAGRAVYAAVNHESRVVALDARDLHKLLEVPADSFPVGVAVSPDGSRLWVTSQGIRLRGGNSITVYDIDIGPGGG